MRTVYALFFILLLLGSSVAMSEKVLSGSNGKGAFAPDFMLKDLSGKYVKSSDLKGSVVFLNFFATWCPPCRAEMPSMERLKKAVPAKGFRMIAVSIDNSDTAAVRAFIEKGGYSFQVLHDRDGAASDLYGVYSIPATFIIDKKGRVVQKVIGSREWDTRDVIDGLKKLMKE